MSSRTIRLSLAVATLWLAGGSAQAQTGAAPADSTLFIAVQGGADNGPAQVAPATALDREVAAIREAFSSRLAGLTAAYRNAPDAGAAAAAQRDIAGLKASFELELLDLQLRLAGERQDPAALAELEAARAAAAVRLGDERRPADAQGRNESQEAGR